MIQHIHIQRIIDANSDLSQAELVKYKAQLEALIANIEGTIPGSRGFGLQNRYVDTPPGDIANILVMELADKCDTYIPAISVDQIKIADIETDGNVSIELTISIREGEDNGIERGHTKHA